MCAPSGITDVEKRAVVEASLSAGARQVHLIEEPIAAAIGAGLAIAEPVGHMVVDVGGGTSEVAVISLGGIVVSRVDAHRRLRARRGDRRATSGASTGMAIGQQTAEDIKFEIGSAAPLEEELATEIRGRDLTTGLPKSVMLTSEEIREALAEPLQRSSTRSRTTLERTPPELAADIAERGILLAGGGVAAAGLRRARADGDRMPAQLAESPLTCVALGSGQSLEEYDAMSALGGAFQSRPPAKRRSRARSRVY